MLDGEAALEEAQLLDHDDGSASYASAGSLEEEFEAVKAEKAASLASLFEGEDLVQVDAGVQDESLLVRFVVARPRPFGSCVDMLLDVVALCCMMGVRRLRRCAWPNCSLAAAGSWLSLKSPSCHCSDPSYEPAIPLGHGCLSVLSWWLRRLPCMLFLAANSARASQLVNCGLSAATVTNLEKKGITALFPIQKHVFEPAMQGRDLIGRARTGSGKTLAFALPVIESLVKARLCHGLLEVPAPFIH